MRTVGSIGRSNQLYDKANDDQCEEAGDAGDSGYEDCERVYANVKIEVLTYEITCKQ